ILYTLMYLFYVFLLKTPLFLYLHFVIPFLLYLLILYSVFYSIKLPHTYLLWTVLVLNSYSLQFYLYLRLTFEPSLYANLLLLSFPLYLKFPLFIVIHIPLIRILFYF